MFAAMAAAAGVAYQPGGCLLIVFQGTVFTAASPGSLDPVSTAGSPRPAASETSSGRTAVVASALRWSDPPWAAGWEEQAPSNIEKPSKKLTRRLRIDP